MNFQCPNKHNECEMNMRLSQDGTLIIAIECEHCKSTYEASIYSMTSPRLVKKEWSDVTRTPKWVKEKQKTAEPAQELVEKTGKK